jgi:hypothetical protein
VEAPPAHGDSESTTTKQFAFFVRIAFIRLRESPKITCAEKSISQAASI